jgi:hypothetical protein
MRLLSHPPMISSGSGICELCAQGFDPANCRPFDAYVL